MQKHFHIGFSLILLPFALGCAISEPYVPNRPPVPLITHKGELNLSGGLDFPIAAGFDCEAVYAPWKHFSIYGALQSGQGGEYTYGPVDSSTYNDHFFEIGVGYFDSVSWWAQYEAYLQIGIGTGADHDYPVFLFRGYNTSSDTTSLNVFRIGIQQNIGSESSVGAIGIGLGLGYEHFFGLNRKYTNYYWPLSDSMFTSTSSFESSPHSTLYAEPVLFWRFGYRYVKIMEEFWLTFNSNSYPLFRGGNESLTLSLDF